MIGYVAKTSNMYFIIDLVKNNETNLLFDGRP